MISQEKAREADGVEILIPPPPGIGIGIGFGIAIDDRDPVTARPGARYR
jgi:hypothetical protein